MINLMTLDELATTLGAALTKVIDRLDRIESQLGKIERSQRKYKRRLKVFESVPSAPAIHSQLFGYIGVETVTAVESPAETLRRRKSAID